MEQMHGLEASTFMSGRLIVCYCMQVCVCVALMRLSLSLFHACRVCVSLITDVPYLLLHVTFNALNKRNRSSEKMWAVCTSHLLCVLYPFRFCIRESVSSSSWAFACVFECLWGSSSLTNVKITILNPTNTKRPKSYLELYRVESRS